MRKIMLATVLVAIGCGGALPPPAPDNPTHGPPHALGTSCVTSQDCVGDYGQGRCIVKDTGAVCYAAVWDESANLMDYCSALTSGGLPQTCCASANVDGSPYSPVAGTDLGGDACFLGVMAPWL